MIKTIIGYDIEPGISVDEYETWLRDIHTPDILANPHVDKIVYNTVIRPVTTTSGGAATIDNGLTMYRVAEMHFKDMAAYEAYVHWWKDNPIPEERGPKGRTAFKFYLLTETTEATRD
jgi:hypothetical protein